MTSQLEIEPAFGQHPSYASELALAKRFCERWRGDSHFRQSLRERPEATLAEAGFPFQEEELRPLYDPKFQSTPSLIARRVQALHREKLAWREELRQGMRLSSPGLDAWRRRQVQRCAWQLGAVNAEAIVHPPAAFELSRGCSVGCWFCGVSAAKLQDHWLANPDNLKLWGQVLEVVAEFTGPAGAASFLYWATDPLDNPDYEHFCQEFARVFGRFPQTTTALALRDVERTRRFLQLSEQHGSPLDRFSVLTLKQLHRIHQEFSPQELLRVELVTQNKESLGAQSAAGKALSKLDTKDAHATTIACISGFLFNMPDRSVRLISPCPASAEHPDGYITFDQETFDDSRHLRQILQRWAELPARLRIEDRPRWRQDLVCLPGPQGFRLQDEVRGMDFQGGPAMAELGRLVGELSVEELCLRVPQDPALTMLNLQRLYEMSLFA